MTIEQIKHEAGQLQPADRERLARWLIDSIDPLPPYADFQAELRRRADDAERNPHLSIPLDEWEAKMRKKIGI